MVAHIERKPTLQFLLRMNFMIFWRIKGIQQCSFMHVCLQVSSPMFKATCLLVHWIADNGWLSNRILVWKHHASFAHMLRMFHVMPSICNPLVFSQYCFPHFSYHSKSNFSNNLHMHRKSQRQSSAFFRRHDLVGQPITDQYTFTVSTIL